MITGRMVMPGAAIKIRENTTCEMPFAAATCQDMKVLVADNGRMYVWCS